MGQSMEDGSPVPMSIVNQLNSLLVLVFGTCTLARASRAKLRIDCDGGV